MDANESILNAIDILTQNAVAKASYDKTIQAQIISCENSLIGKYKCRYQDSIFYAFASNTQIKYAKNAYVYVLVPGNNMSNIKTIIGSASRLGNNYISVAEQDTAYDTIGINSINSSVSDYYLDTNNKDYQCYLYKFNNDAEDNYIQIDQQVLKEYMRESAYIIAGASFKTNIAANRQQRGHYGITYNLLFKDNSSDQNILRSFTIDEDAMKDDPYRLISQTRQVQVFDIDGQNFLRLESIVIFNKDFPEADSDITQVLLDSGDIKINNLEFWGANRLSESELNGISLSFFTPQGIIFKKDSLSTDYKTITVQVKLKGVIVDNIDGIQYYWGREDTKITSNSPQYNNFLGRGWRCLNNYNVIASETQQEKEIIEWVPGDKTYILNFLDATAKQNKIKVAAFYEGSIVTKEINIKNLTDETFQISIVTDDGITDFFFDYGHPNLTCLVNGEDAGDEQYIYHWGVENNKGIFSALPETTEENDRWYSAKSQLYQLELQISAGEKFPNAEKENLERLRANVNAFDHITRVIGNKIYAVQISGITNYSTYKCSVFNRAGAYLGTGFITLTNSLQAGEDEYSLVINNGSAVFKYDEDGKAPNNRSKEKRQQIKALTFSIYDKFGNAIEQEVIKNLNNYATILWMIPNNNTLITYTLEDEEQLPQDQDYIYVENVYNLTYNIQQMYNFNSSNNQIKLIVYYKNLVLKAETQFTFLKDGEQGTNGSEYTVRLIPNTRMAIPPQYPLVTTIESETGSSYIINYGIESTSDTNILSPTIGRKLFQIQLWKSGNLIWHGTSVSHGESLDGESIPDVVRWEILSNKYSYQRGHYDESAFEIIDANEGLIVFKGDFLKDSFTAPMANIIKCTVAYKGKPYYGMIPISVAWVASNDYRIQLKDNTGFREALYSPSGVLPQFNQANPFEFIAWENIKPIDKECKIWEDISLVDGEHAVNFYSTYCGDTKGEEPYQRISSYNLIPERYPWQELNKNQFRYRTSAMYNGECVNNAVLCSVSRNSNILMKISIPVYFFLNKYSFPNINGWDGNSVEINEQGGYILSPQMGAGHKDNDNRFTGVFMGDVREAERPAAQTGLFGYASGVRTFFLNADTGVSIFGKPGNGQIIIDPGDPDNVETSKAYLYSYDFWKEYNPLTQIPVSYDSANENHHGLLIDLTTPAIRFGDGNFVIKETLNEDTQQKQFEFSVGNENEGSIFFNKQGLKIKASSIDIQGTAVASQDYVDDVRDLLQKSIDEKIFYGVYRVGLNQQQAIEQNDFSPTIGEVSLSQGDFLFISTTQKTFIYSGGQWKLFETEEGNYLADKYNDGALYRWGKTNNKYYWLNIADYNKAIDKSVGVYLHFQSNGNTPGLMLANMKDYPSVQYTNDNILNEHNIVLTASGNSSGLLLRKGQTVLTKIGSGQIVVGKSGYSQVKITDSSITVGKPDYSQVTVTDSSITVGQTTKPYIVVGSNAIYLKNAGGDHNIAEFGANIKINKPGTNTSIFSIIDGNGSFSGKITASTGTIGGWNINSDGLSSTDISMSASSGFQVSGLANNRWTSAQLHSGFLKLSNAYGHTDLYGGDIQIFDTYNGTYTYLTGSSIQGNCYIDIYGRINSGFHIESTGNSLTEGQMIANGESGNIYLFSQTLDRSKDPAERRNIGVYTTSNGGSVITVAPDGSKTFHGKANSVSDLKQKKIISNFDWKLDEFINGLSPIAYYLKHSDGTYGKRIHMGFGAQDVSKLAKEINMGDLSMYDATIKGDPDSETDYHDKPYHGQSIDDEKLNWGLDYAELVAPIILQLQQLMKRVSYLENKIQEIKGENEYANI